MTEENKTARSSGWFRSAKDKFRSFAYGDRGEPKERPRVGLALAGGFARGIAHLGVLRVLREAGIPIDCVAGTSVGALIAAGFCAGASLDEMAKIGAATSFADFGRWTPSWLGLATNQRMEKYLARFTHVKTFEELQTPLAIATTDITAGVSVYYSHGPIAPPLRGSCAYPGLLCPFNLRGGRWSTDSSPRRYQSRAFCFLARTWSSPFTWKRTTSNSLARSRTSSAAPSTSSNGIAISPGGRRRT